MNIKVDLTISLVLDTKLSALLDFCPKLQIKILFVNSQNIKVDLIMGLVLDTKLS